MKNHVSLAKHLPLALLLSCGGVDHIEAPQEPLVIHDGLPIDLNCRPLDSSGDELPVTIQVLASSDPTVVQVQDGVAFCRASGKARLDIAAGGATTGVTVACRMVDRIVTQPQRVDLLRGEASMAEVALHWQVLDEEGEPIPGLEPQFIAMDSDVVELLPGPRLRPVNTGRTVIRVSTSTRSIDVPVRTGQLLGKIGLDTGGTLLLPPGSVELRVAGDHGARLRVMPGSDCSQHITVKPGQPRTCTQERPTHATVSRRPGSSSRLLMIDWPPAADTGTRE